VLLSALSLVSNNIEDAGAMALAVALRQNPTIESLE
jgi:hypothetical protein